MLTDFPSVKAAYSHPDQLVRFLAAKIEAYGFTLRQNSKGAPIVRIPASAVPKQMLAQNSGGFWIEAGAADLDISHYADEVMVRPASTTPVSPFCMTRNLAPVLNRVADDMRTAFCVGRITRWFYTYPDNADLAFQGNSKANEYKVRLRVPNHEFEDAAIAKAFEGKWGKTGVTKVEFYDQYVLIHLNACYITPDIWNINAAVPIALGVEPTKFTDLTPEPPTSYDYVSKPLKVGASVSSLTVGSPFLPPLSEEGLEPLVGELKKGTLSLGLSVDTTQMVQSLKVVSDAAAKVAQSMATIKTTLSGKTVTTSGSKPSFGHENPFCDNPECARHFIKSSGTLIAKSGERAAVKLSGYWGTLGRWRIESKVEGVKIVSHFCDVCEWAFRSDRYLAKAIPEQSELVGFPNVQDSATSFFCYNPKCVSHEIVPPNQHTKLLKWSDVPENAHIGVVPPFKGKMVGRKQHGLMTSLNGKPVAFTFSLCTCCSAVAEIEPCN
ncbi:hypothetical protein [Burkholderia ubonensis]|uniref:hypothetical protein n=1 Tax=Burkholderia ubonensis TaxID=101571 RepID=UPI000B3277E9|nr:hypothetical protein [Burkholderia ubonensis]